jgi:hypothetical protein
MGGDMRSVLRVGILVCLALIIAGCDTLMERRYSIFNSRAQTVGPNQLVEPEAFEPIYLPAVLAPEQPAYKHGPGTKKKEEIGAEIDQAFNIFNKKRKGSDYAFHRNAVQDRILAASTQRCNFYKQYLRRIDQSTNLFLGSLTTITGAVGAIVTGATAARVLAGSASMFSGLRSEFNETMFAGLAMQVITDGIDLRRNKLREKIETRRTANNNETNYTVELAVNDALEFHGACSLTVGLKEAGAAIKRAQNPGVMEALRMQQMLQSGRVIAEDQPVFAQVELSKQIGRVEAVAGEVSGTVVELKPRLGGITPAPTDFNKWDKRLDGIKNEIGTHASAAKGNANAGLVKLMADGKAQDQKVNQAKADLAQAWELEKSTAAELATLESERQAAAAIVAAGEEQLNAFLKKANELKEELADLDLKITGAGG